MGAVKDQAIAEQEAGFPLLRRAPMLTITVDAIERSVPTNIPYRSERLASFTVTLEPSDEMPSPKLLASIRRAQLADLDAQEAVLRARWDIHVPASAKVAAAPEFHEEPQQAGLVMPNLKPGGPLVTYKGDPFQDGASLAADKRKCSHASHVNPRGIDIKSKGLLTIDQYNFAMRERGAPYCAEHFPQKRGA